MAFSKVFISEAPSLEAPENIHQKHRGDIEETSGISARIWRCMLSEPSHGKQKTGDAQAIDAKAHVIRDRYVRYVYATCLFQNSTTNASNISEMENMESM